MRLAVIERMRALMRTPVVFTGRNRFTPDPGAQHGFTDGSMGCA
jgi:hypothetical protein